MRERDFFNRDISWLSFNDRVLREAEKDHVPLLERIRFLSIYSSNLDEFYRVRIPVLQALHEPGETGGGNSLYLQASSIITEQQQLFGLIFNTKIRPGLRDSGIQLVYNQPIPTELIPMVTEYFFNHVAGLIQLVPLLPKVDFFPENNQLYMLVLLSNEGNSEMMVLVNIPCDVLPRFFKIEQQEIRYIIFLEDVIRENLHHLFAGKTVKGAYNIKITRDAELNLEETYEGDLEDRIEKELLKRDRGLATRLLYEPTVALRHLHGFVEIFNLGQASLVEGTRYHNLKDLVSLPLNNPVFSYPNWPASQHVVTKKTLFESIAGKDIIVHTPYQSYETILRFFNEAAIDHTVQEIHTTLYRVASDSRIVLALISAARNGKKVTVMVELKARFDEANNIRWAKKMKANGVKLIYSSNILKVHAKVALVVRNTFHQPCLGLFATGNLNENTARFYTDHILLTAHPAMLAELQMLFAFLARKKMPETHDKLPFDHLLVARFNLKDRFVEMINREIAFARLGLAASIIIKMNNLEEEVLIRKLYEASEAGVKIQLLIRGICRLVPAIPGFSEHISIKRIVDRYLEHGRVFIFHNNGKEEIYLGSADWMNRNIYRRIEVCFPIYDPSIKAGLKHLVNLQLNDNTQAVWIDANLRNVQANNSDAPLRSQEAIYDYLQANQQMV